MKTYQISNTDLEVSRIAYGCMKIGGRWDVSPPTEDDRGTAARACMAAFDAGINLFDHADIYARGKSETVFGDFLAATPGFRDKIVLQSKCGIRIANTPNPGDPQRYDFSYKHIVSSAETSLQRLRTDRLDILLLHRPDALVEPAEVARAFDDLYSSGKVRYFGVSNHTAGQIALLQKFVRQRLIINQVELSLLHSNLIAEGIHANRPDASCMLASGMLDYCRLNDMLIQAWGPVASGKLFKQDVELTPAERNTAELVRKLAAEKQTSPEAIMIGWLLRLPVGIQPIVGTTNPERIAASCLADPLELTREEWYTLYTAARGTPLP